MDKQQQLQFQSNTTPHRSPPPEHAAVFLSFCPIYSLSQKIISQLFLVSDPILPSHSRSTQASLRSSFYYQILFSYHTYPTRSHPSFPSQLLLLSDPFFSSSHPIPTQPKLPFSNSNIHAPLPSAVFIQGGIRIPWRPLFFNIFFYISGITTCCTFITSRSLWILNHFFDFIYIYIYIVSPNWGQHVTSC